MTVPLTSTVIVLGTSAADSNACTGTTLPINLSHRVCRPFPPWRLTQSRRSGLERRTEDATDQATLPDLGVEAPSLTAPISGPLLEGSDDPDLKAARKKQLDALHAAWSAAGKKVRERFLAAVLPEVARTA